MTYKDFSEQVETYAQNNSYKEVQGLCLSLVDFSVESTLPRESVISKAVPLS